MIIEYNETYWELATTVTESSQYVSNGKEVYTVVRTQGALRSMYYTVSLDNNLMSAKPLTLRGLKALMPYHAVKKETNSFEHLIHFELLSSHKDMLNFVTDHKELNGVISDLYNSDDNDTAITLMLDSKHLIDNSIVSGQTILHWLDLLLDQFEVAGFIKNNMDGLHYLNSLSYNTNALYHKVEGDKIKIIEVEEIEEMKRDFVKHIYYNRNSF